MPKMTPAQAAEKLRQRISQSGTAYSEGVDRVTVNPAEQAAAANDKWVARIQDAIANDRFRKGLSRVTLQSWRSAVKDYGVSRYTQGAEKASRNYLRFAQEFFPFVETVQDEIASMPNMTIDDAISRMTHNVRRLHEFKNR